LQLYIGPLPISTQPSWQAEACAASAFCWLCADARLYADAPQFHYTASEKPHIQNDTITISTRLAGDHLIKLSISHALSQSTKLCVFEEQVLEIVAHTKDLPAILATTGRAPPSSALNQKNRRLTLARR
jgi:Uncharacterised ACR, YagE family COG1723